MVPDTAVPGVLLQQVYVAGVLAAWGCRGGLCDERPGLPHQRHSQLQGTHHRAQLSPIGQCGGALTKGKMLLGSVRSEGKKKKKKSRSERNKPVNTKLRAEGERGGAPGTGVDTPLQTMQSTTLELIIPLHPVEDSMLEQVDVP